MILPLIIILTNIILIIGLKRRNYQRRYQLGTNKHDDWKERSMILYMLLSCIGFLILTSPVGILAIYGIINGEKIPTNNLSIIFDLMEIIHHCSHFPILLMTSSLIRNKLFRIRRKKSKQSISSCRYKKTLNQQKIFLTPSNPHLITSC